MQKKIEIVGSNRIIRESLMESLSFESDFLIRETYYSPTELYQEIVETVLPDVCIFFINRMDEEFLYILDRLKKTYPSIINIVICHNNLLPANRLLIKGGIDIQIGDQTNLEDLKRLIRVVTEKRNKEIDYNNLKYGYISKDLIKLSIQDYQNGDNGNLSSLSRREKEVFDLFLKGMSEADIAIFLDIQTRTVHRYINSVREKLRTGD